MLVIAGLGNPGDSYINTRHNLGFQAVEALAKAYQSDFYDKPNFAAQYAKLSVATKSVLLVKPQTYMNNSGIALLKLYSFYKSTIQKLVVIYDDLDLPAGRVKIKIAGGSAGHKGIQSIDQHLGNKYIKLRIGIGRPARSSDVAQYVLARFNPEEKIAVDTAVQELINNFPALVEVFSKGKTEDFHTIMKAPSK